MKAWILGICGALTASYSNVGPAAVRAVEQQVTKLFVEDPAKVFCSSCEQSLRFHRVQDKVIGQAGEHKQGLIGQNACAELTTLPHQSNQGFLNVEHRFDAMS